MNLTERLLVQEKTNKQKQNLMCKLVGKTNSSTNKAATQSDCMINIRHMTIHAKLIASPHIYYHTHTTYLSLDNQPIREADIINFLNKTIWSDLFALFL